MKNLLTSILFLTFGLCGFAQQFEPEWAREVSILKINNDTIVIPAEKSIPKIKTSASAGRILVGIGKYVKKLSLKMVHLQPKFIQMTS